MRARRGGGIVLATIALGGLAVALGANPALAVSRSEAATFVGCPRRDPQVGGCVAGRMEQGTFTIGRFALSLTNAIAFQGGFGENATGEEVFYGSPEGTFSKVPQRVSLGGLAVTVTVELAGTIGLDSNALLLEAGAAWSLPVKFRLENPTFGRCYLGSTSNPVMLELGDGITSPPPPNRPIRGKLGAISTRAEARVLVMQGAQLVDNSFAAPRVTECVQGPNVGALIDLLIGLPSPAGKNTAVVTERIEEAGLRFVNEALGQMT